MIAAGLLFRWLLLQGTAPDLDALLEEGRARVERGDLRAVLDGFRREEARFGSEPRFLQFLGFLLERSGDVEGALERYADAARRDPAEPYAARQRAGLLSKLRRFREAEEVYRTLLERHPGDEEAREGLQFVREERGKLGKIGEAAARLRLVAAGAALEALLLLGFLVWLVRRR